MVWSVKYHLFCENGIELPYKYAVVFFFSVYIAAVFRFNEYEQYEYEFLWLKFLVGYYAVYQVF